MKTILLAITAALAVVAAMQFFSKDSSPAKRLLGLSPVESAWNLWRQQNARAYGTDTEESYRFKIFSDNYNKINAFNASSQSSTVALNRFADLTTAEFKTQFTGFNKSKMVRDNKTTYLSTVGLPSSYDARDDGLVNPVKDQGQCGSCWAFSTVGAIESQRAKQNLGLQSFSEQMLVDCAPLPNQGCNGGLMTVALEWVQSNPLALETAYPYTARDGTCQSSGKAHPGSITGSGKVAPENAQMRAAIYQYGAVSVGIEADQMAFQFYSGGVITSGCGTQEDHGVTAIGWGNESGSDYFLVRNSWGADWGLSGYVKIAPNQCGIMNDANYATA